MPPPSQYTPYYPITVAAGLRFNDRNGIPVTEMYPVASTQPLDNPETGYISLIGSKVSDLLAVSQSVNTILAQYNTRITTLESEVDAIQTSGVTFQLYVNGGCLLGNLSVTVPAAVTALIENTCDYNEILGTTTELANSIAAQCSNLNTAPAYSQNSTMSGLSGWDTDPTTLAAAVNNLWKTACDLRGGMETILDAVTPTCSQVIVDYAVVLNSGMSFNLYFDGYTFIPTGFTDNTSTLMITDTTGNFYTTTFNIVTQSTSSSPLVINTSGSTVSPTSQSYQVEVVSKVQNTTLGLTCEKTVFKTVQNSSGSTGLFDISTYVAVVNGSSIQIVSGLSYLPRHASISPTNSFTGGILGDLNYSPYLSYVGGGVYLNAIAPISGTLSLSITTFR